MVVNNYTHRNVPDAKTDVKYNDSSATVNWFMTSYIYFFQYLRKGEQIWFPDLKIQQHEQKMLWIIKMAPAAKGKVSMMKKAFLTKQNDIQSEAYRYQKQVQQLMTLCKNLSEAS